MQAAPSMELAVTVSHKMRWAVMIVARGLMYRQFDAFVVPMILTVAFQDM